MRKYDGSVVLLKRLRSCSGSFALAEAVKKPSLLDIEHGFQARRMRADALELTHQHANRLRAHRNLETEKPPAYVSEVVAQPD
jgi:hypothetical protein